MLVVEYSLCTLLHEMVKSLIQLAAGAWLNV